MRYRGRRRCRVDSFYLAGDREVRFGLRLAEGRFELVLEARVKPAADDSRRCDVVFACKDIVSPPVRLANSIWQGVKIGLAAEPVKSPALNWLDQKSDLIF